MNKRFALVLFAPIIGALLILAMFGWPTPAAATNCDIFGCYHTPAPRRARKYKAPKRYDRYREDRYDRDDYRGYRSRDGVYLDALDRDRDFSPRCLDGFVDITSTEHTNPENGMEAAKKMWMAKVQWHHGSKYMDPKNAANYREGCSASNPMDTMSGRLSEGVNKIIGQEGQNIRCVIVARPCRMVLEKTEGHR